MVFSAVSNVATFFTGVFKQKAEVKKIKEETKLKINKAKAALKIAEIVAKKNIVMSHSKVEGNYDVVALRQKEKTIVDDIGVGLVYVLLFCCFLPVTQEHINMGFKTLGDAPFIVQFMIIGVFVSTFGLLGLFRLLRGKGVNK